MECENCGDPIDTAGELPTDNDGKTLYICWPCFWSDNDYCEGLVNRIKALPRDGASQSRDAGRGYAQAIRDVLEILEGTDGNGRTRGEDPLR